MSNLYMKLAGTNIKNNRQFYIPYLLTGILTVAMFYMIVFLNNNSGLESMPGGTDLKIILAMGVYVIGFFASIFLFYTNSFIIKRRKKEVGIYNILGMEKRHIARMLLLETLFVIIVAIAGGLAFGIVFSKLMMMFLYKLMHISESIVFYVSLDGIRMSVILFGVIYLAAYCYNLVQIKLANPVELLSGSSVGEREPKTKALLAILGVACIGVGYYIAITTKNPLKVLMLFFLAVLLVIIGTYCLFTAGSIALLKMLRRNKKFYYNSRHFTAVSGMFYRMKQNAVGLANICILSTMVLVMVSGTVCLYLGSESIIGAKYRGEICVTAQYQDLPEDYDPEVLVGQVKEQIRENGRMITRVTREGSFSVMAVKENGEYVFGLPAMFDEDNSYLFYIMTKEDFLAGNDKIKADEIGELAENEAVLYGKDVFDDDTLTIGGMDYSVVQTGKYLAGSEKMFADTLRGLYYVVVKDMDAVRGLFEAQKAAYGENASMYECNLYIDIEGTAQEKIACAESVANETFADRAGDGWESFHADGKQQSYSSFYALYGGLFFLGIFLGVMFLMVTVVIIFYKQISEGYDDKHRFEIMQKVGMSRREVWATIRSQVRIVFFLPLLVAAIHVWAAFPLICRLISMLYMTDTVLFCKCVAGTIFCFAVIYYLVFKMTSRAYYKIVK